MLGNTGARDRVGGQAAAAVAQLTSFLGWATVAVGVSQVPGFPVPLLVVPLAGAIAGMVQERAFGITLIVEVVMLAACVAAAPSAEAFIWLAVPILGAGRAAVFWQRRRAGIGAG